MHVLTGQIWHRLRMNPSLTAQEYFSRSETVALTWFTTSASEDPLFCRARDKRDKIMTRSHKKCINSTVVLSFSLSWKPWLWPLRPQTVRFPWPVKYQKKISQITCIGYIQIDCSEPWVYGAAIAYHQHVSELDFSLLRPCMTPSNLPG